MGNSLGNRILFPAPSSSYDESLPGLIIETDDTSSVKHALAVIPAPSKPESRPYILYFHGNACDVGSMYHELMELSAHANSNVVAVEYPGYGVLAGPEPTADLLDSAAEFGIAYLFKKSVPSDRIVLFGRSIGSGLACKLAHASALRGQPVAGVILQSPYTSIHGIVREYSWLGPWVIPDHWKNDEILATHDGPLLVIHGEADDIISPSHGKRLYELCKSTNKRLLTPANATHNEWHLYADVVFPVRDFLLKHLT